MGKNYTIPVCFTYIVKFGLTMGFAEVPVCQFVNFSPAETEIIDAEIFKLLSKCFIVNTTKKPNDSVPRKFLRGPNKMVIIE